MTDDTPTPPNPTPRRRRTEVDDGRHGPPRSSLTGSWIHDRYEVLEELGWGSLGHVYLARDHLRRHLPDPRDDTVALKVVRRDRLSPQSLAYLKREFRALSHLHHPHVARVYDLDVVPGRGELFFTLELLRGRTLVQAAQALPLDTTLDLLVQTLRALAFIHARGVIHMDLKPQNVFVLDDPLRVKVLDFHLARHTSDPPDPRLRGTLAYMPPEVIDRAPVDHRADLYSLGCVTYEALAGHPPFANRPSQQILEAHTQEPPPPLPDSVPPPLAHVVQRLLAKDPAERFPSANDVIRALNLGLDRDDALETQETLASYLDTGRLVGRDHAIETVLEHARPLLDGPPPTHGPWVVLVTGEDGVGKSRFLYELKVALQLEGLPTLLEHPHGLDSHAAAPFRRALSEMLRRAGRGEFLERIAAPGASLDPERLASLDPSPEDSPRVRRTSALVDLLRHVATDHPFALLVDDAHDTDGESLELIRALAHSPPPRALLVVAARTLDAPNAPHLDLGPTIPLHLPRLAHADIHHLVASMLGLSQPPTQLADRVWSVTGGNPRLVAEQLRALAESGVARPHDGQLDLALDDLERLLPEASIRVLLAQRVARLPDDPALLLGAVAASPRPRPLPFAAAAAALPLDRAHDALDTLRRRGLIAHPTTDPSPTAPLVLEHEPLRAVALEALGDERARELHRRAAQLLAQHHPLAAPDDASHDPDEELLYHYLRAHEPELAFTHAHRAADHAFRRREFRRAADLYAQTLQLAPDDPTPDLDVDREPLQLRLARCLAATGRRPQALETLRDLSSPEALRLSARILKERGQLTHALSLLERALAGLDDPLQRARTLAERARIHHWLARYDLALTDAQSALDTLVELDREAESVAVLDLLHHVHRARGEDDLALSSLKRGLRVRYRHAESQPDRESRSLRPEALDPDATPCLGDLDGPHLPRTLLESALERADRSHDLFDYATRRSQLLLAAGDPPGAGCAFMNLGHLHRASGRFLAALDAYEHAHDLFQTDEATLGVTLVAIAQAHTSTCLRAPDALDLTRQALDHARATEAPWVTALALLTHTEAARLHDPDLAQRALDDAHRAAADLQHAPLQTAWTLLRAHVRHDLHDLPGALEALQVYRDAPPGQRSVLQDLRATLLHADLGLLTPDDTKTLNLSVGRATRVFDQAAARDLPDLRWRAAWTRARLHRTLQRPDLEFDDLVAAMDQLRRLAHPLPPNLQTTFLSAPAPRTLRQRFTQLR